MRPKIHAYDFVKRRPKSTFFSINLICIILYLYVKNNTLAIEIIVRILNFKSTYEEKLEC